MRDEHVARIRWNDQVCWAASCGRRLAVLNGSPIDGLSRTGRFLELSEVEFLPPVPATKLIGIGANFPGEDSQGSDPYPSFFIKPPSAFAGHQSSVRLPHVFRAVAAEGELAVVVKRRCRNLKPEDVSGTILGWTIVNDLSGRDSVLACVPAAVKKSADGFAPMGPQMNLDPRIRHFTIVTRCNGAVVQQGSTSAMRFDVVQCLTYVTSILTLEPYDIVALGTPSPKPLLMPGDEVSVAIDEIGELVNRIESPQVGTTPRLYDSPAESP